MKLLLEQWRGYLSEEDASHTEKNIYGWTHSDLIDMMVSSESPPDEEDIIDVSPYYEEAGV